MAKKKVYDVRWEDGDGEQGYYVEMTPFEARGIEGFLERLVKAGAITHPEVGALEGDRLVSARGLIDEVRQRYEAEDIPGLE